MDDDAPAGQAADPTAAQYEAYPYPERDPADEARRLIVGSPSHPAEIDHFLCEGGRDWSRPWRALIAGGGSGDALIMLGQLLKTRGAPAELVYLDRSRAARRVAEARAAARGLEGVRFETGDLMTAPELGRFDYIDCCGVLHHLPDPEAGLRALAAALAPEGGLGAMVYAPHGRAGVYEMQDAARALTPEDEPPAARLEVIEALAAAAPPTNGFLRNPFLSDHRSGPAGLYDLLLSPRDQAFDVARVRAALAQADLELAGFLEPARYRADTYLAGAPEALRARAVQLGEAEEQAFAERFAGNIKAHVFYAAPRGRARPRRAPAALAPDRTPALHQIDGAALAASVARAGRLRFTVDGLTIERAARGPARRLWPQILSLIDGRRSLGAIQARTTLDWLAFAAAAGPLFDALIGFNALHFTRFYAGGPA